MNCKSVQSQLSAYIDNELSGCEMHLVRAHLAQCAACAAEELDIRRLKGLLSSGAHAEPASDFEERLVQHVFAGRSCEERRQARVFAPVRFMTVAAAAAAAAYFAATLLDARPTRPTADTRGELQFVSDQAYYSGTDPLMGNSVVPIDYAGR